MRSPCNFALPLQKDYLKMRNTKRKAKKTKRFFLLIITFSQAKDDCPKELLSSERPLPNKRLLLQSLAGQHKHQDFFIASCCGIVNTTISTFPQFPSDFVIRMRLLVVSGVLRRCRAASAVFPVPSQPAEEFLVVGCQQ